MLRNLLSGLALFVSAATASAYDIGTIIDRHVIPGYETLARRAVELDTAAQASCSADSHDLRAAYNAAFDAWVRVSHIRFGPSEDEDRAFALAFWPDTRGFTPRELATLIETEDPVIETQEEFSHVSIAARGFYAMEFLLYDPQFTAAEPEDYRCALVRAVARDIEANAEAILAGWQDGYAVVMLTAGENDTYRSREEAAQRFFGAVATGLQFTSDTRLGRPLGTFDRPRPNRAEARRSGRALRNVVLSLEGTRQLVRLLAEDSETVTDTLDAAYDRAFEQAKELEDDPVLEGVDDPQQRLKIEILQQNIDRIRELLGTSLGPLLGVGTGFNAMDGD